jgi:hypothetical protein
MLPMRDASDVPVAVRDLGAHPDLARPAGAWDHPKGSTAMFRKNHIATLSAVFALGVGMDFVAAARGQETSPGLSSGSGEGTGTGLSTGVQRNRTGSMSGVGPIGTGLDRPGVPLPRFLPGDVQNRVDFGPGVDVNFPNDPYLLPFLQLVQGAFAVDSKIPTGVSEELLKNARRISDPGQRSLALYRIANGAIFSKQLLLAHHTLEEAIAATAQVTTPLVRDQRLSKIVTSLTTLTEWLLIEGRNKLGFQFKEDALVKKEDVPPLDALPDRLDVPGVVRLARLEWKRGVYLASLIGNPTYRNEELYRIAESAASGSAKLAIDFTNPPEPEPASEGLTEAQKQRRSEALARHEQMLKKLMPELLKQADEILVTAFEDAKKIERLIWKYRAMVRIAISAAESRQFARGVKLAAEIDNAESRAEAMLLLAEAQCRQDQNDEATFPYQEAARAVASIQQEGLRGVLARFLVDSLIASGRFDDARLSTSLDPDPGERFMLLGAVAEAQGRRGSPESARRWIASQETPEIYRAALYRRVSNGVLWAIEQNRGRATSDQLEGEVRSRR